MVKTASLVVTVLSILVVASTCEKSSEVGKKGFVTDTAQISKRALATIGGLTTAEYKAFCVDKGYDYWSLGLTEQQRADKRDGIKNYLSTSIDKTLEMINNGEIINRSKRTWFNAMKSSPAILITAAVFLVLLGLILAGLVLAVLFGWAKRESSLPPLHSRMTLTPAEIEEDNKKRAVRHREDFDEEKLLKASKDKIAYERRKEEIKKRREQEDALVLENRKKSRANKVTHNGTTSTFYQDLNAPSRSLKVMRITAIVVLVLIVAMISVGVIAFVYVGMSYKAYMRTRCAFAGVHQIVENGELSSAEGKFIGAVNMDNLITKYTEFFNYLASSGSSPYATSAGALSTPSATTLSDLGSNVQTSSNKIKSGTFTYTGLDSVAKITSPGVGSALNDLLSGSASQEINTVKNLCVNLGKASEYLSKSYTSTDVSAITQSIRTYLGNFNMQTRRHMFDIMQMLANPKENGDKLKNYAIGFLVILTVVVLCTVAAVLASLIAIVPAYSLADQNSANAQQMSSDYKAIVVPTGADSHQQTQLQLHQNQKSAIGEKDIVVSERKPLSNVSQPRSAVAVQQPLKPAVPIVGQKDSSKTPNETNRVNYHDGEENVDISIEYSAISGHGEKHQIPSNLKKLKVHPGYNSAVKIRKEEEQSKMFIDPEDFKERDRLSRLVEEFPESFKGEKANLVERESRPVKSFYEAENNSMSQYSKARSVSASAISNNQPNRSGYQIASANPRREFPTQINESHAKPIQSQSKQPVIHYKEKFLAVSPARTLLILGVVIFFLLSVLLFVHTVISYLVSVYMGVACKSFVGVLNDKDFMATQVNKKQFYGEYFVGAIRECISPGGSRDFSKVFNPIPINANLLGVIDAMAGLNLYSDQINFIKDKSTPETAKVSINTNNLKTFQSADTNGGSNEFDAGLQKVNSNKCAQDVMAYNGKCPSGYTQSKSTDAYNEKLGDKYCIELPNIMGTSSGSTYTQRYSGAACSAVSSGDAQVTLTSAIKSFLSYQTRVTTLSSNVEEVLDKQVDCLTYLSDTANFDTNVKALQNDAKIKELAAFQSSLPGGSESLTSCGFFRAATIKIENTMCYSLFTSTYWHTSLIFATAILCFFLTLALSMFVYVLGDVRDMSDGPN